MYRRIIRKICSLTFGCQREGKIYVVMLLCIMLMIVMVMMMIIIIIINITSK
jgi:hypothetical protein